MRSVPHRLVQSLLCAALVSWLPVAAIADTVTVPFGTTVFCELDEQVTSKKKETSEGDLVRAHVWKDVWVDGRLVIEAGTPVYTRVSEVKKAKFAGIKGKLELESLNVQAVDGRDVPLDGGYDKSGRGRMGLSIALAAVVAWPLVFIKGKQAILEPGTIFDAMVRGPVDITVPDQSADSGSLPVLTVQPDLEIVVLYDEMDPDAKIKDLPLELRMDAGEPIASASIVSVNGAEIEPMPLVIGESPAPGIHRCTVDFKMLSKHFTRGMNRFEIEAGGYRAEVLLEIEL